MSDPSLELQAALILALRNNIGAEVGPRVYDQPPPTPAFPYCTLGPCQVLPDKAGCIDGVEIYPQIDVWSRPVGPVGFPEAKRITKAILLKLDDQPLSVDGFNVVVFEVQSINYIRDQDGITNHAAISFHGIITPA